MSTGAIVAELPRNLQAYRAYVGEMWPDLREWIDETTFDHLVLTKWGSFAVGRHPHGAPILQGRSSAWQTYVAVVREMVAEGLVERKDEAGLIWYRQARV